MSEPEFLDGVPSRHVLDRLAAAGGKEVESGKLLSPDSSAALAVNTFGWFVPPPRRKLLPPFPGLESAFPAELVEVEYCARFPWAGGRHPWLDAVAITPSHLVGVESKRFEPFRGAKKPSFSEKYGKHDWGGRTDRYCRVRERLISGELRFSHLDAAQLVKHAYGLVTDAKRNGKRPALVYLFAEPARVAAGDIARHREEIAAFAGAVAGDEVSFHATSYRQWLATFPAEARDHATAVLSRFAP